MDRIIDAINNNDIKAEFVPNYKGTKYMRDAENYMTEETWETSKRPANVDDSLFAINVLNKNIKITYSEHIAVNNHKIYAHIIELLNKRAISATSKRRKGQLLTAIFFYLDVSGTLDRISNTNLVKEYRKKCYDKEFLKETMWKYNKTIFFDVDKVSLNNTIKFMKARLPEFALLSKDQLMQRPEIKKLKGIHRRSLVNETYDIQGNRGSWATNFPFPDAAHIVTIKRCIALGKPEWIANAKNGLLLDPNTHKMKNAHKVFLQADGSIVDSEDKTYRTINKKYLNDERQFFIDQQLKLNK